MSADVLETLLEAIMGKTVARIRYRSRGGESERDIQPIGLYASSGYWYCPAYCMQRGEIRQFRADRIVTAELRPDIPGREDIAVLTLADRPENAGREGIELVVELSAEGAWQLESNRRFGPFMERFDDGSGRIRMKVPREELPFHVDALWPLCAQARITAPEEAVRLVGEKLREMGQAYGIYEA
jgi:predicted DNA-binding transcriptional regulator YafY